ncbi:hypothetical protein SUDANB1_01649 [Streptomyces sp. enrichment culture]
MCRCCGRSSGTASSPSPPGDRRVRTVRLTEAGRQERALLDDRGDALSVSLPGPLDGQQRERLTSAMAEVERLLTASMVSLEDLDPDHPDAAHCLRSYAAELSELFDGGFDPGHSLLPDTGELRAPRGLFLVARLHGEPVGLRRAQAAGRAPRRSSGCGLPRDQGTRPARRLLSELEARAARHGSDRVRLDTNQA